MVPVPVAGAVPWPADASVLFTLDAGLPSLTLPLTTLPLVLFGGLPLLKLPPAVAELLLLLLASTSSPMAFETPA